MMYRLILNMITRRNSDENFKLKPKICTRARPWKSFVRKVHNAATTYRYGGNAASGDFGCRFVLPSLKRRMPHIMRERSRSSIAADR